METNYQLIKTKLLKKKAKAVTQEDLLYPERLKQIVLDHDAHGVAHVDENGFDDPIVLHSLTPCSFAP